MEAFSNQIQSIRQQWSSFEAMTTLQKSERSKDIENLLNSIDKKIETNNIFTHTKNKIAQEQCNAISNRIDLARNKTANSLLKEKQNIEYCRKKCQSNCASLKSSIEKGAEAFENQLQNKTNDIKQSILKQIKSEQQKYANQRKQLNDAKNFIENEIRRCQKVQNQSLNSIKSKMQESILEVNEFLNQKKSQKRQKELKLKYMAQSIMTELEKMIDRQQKFGKMTYESLLKLIQDFYGFIQGKNMKS